VFSFFRNSKDLSNWIRRQETLSKAFEGIIKIMSLNRKVTDNELDVKDAVTDIYNDDDKSSSNILFKILSNYNITKAKLNKGVYMKKESQSRQKNDWMRGERNKWNRAVDGHKEETPWRVNRDQFFDFTHYTTDAISFDANPNNVYSGEALWRMYVMDKFYREYKTADGRWVGGYINDRFHVFPDGGTPANPDVDRLHGNQMQLGLNERTRKPREHQYSTERRLEEARGNETFDLEVTTTAGSFNKLVKTASKTPVNRNDDVVYNVFSDYLEMKQAGVDYGNMLELVSDHYDIDVTHVAQIAKFADKMVQKHNQIAYAFEVSNKQIKTASKLTFETTTDIPGQVMTSDQGALSPVSIIAGTTLVKIGPNLYEIASGAGLGEKVIIESDISNFVEALDGQNDDNIQEAADELLLNDEGDVENTEETTEDDLNEFEISEL
jgi:hypothetical protein